MNQSTAVLRARTSESTARRIVGRIGANPVTWLRHQVERTVDLSPETLSHIRGQFRKLTLKYGHLSSLSDEIAEREYLRIAYRLNFMRTQEKLYRMKVTDKGFFVLSKQLGVFAAQTLKYKSSNGKRVSASGVRRPVPTAATRQPEREADEPEESDGETA